MSFLSAVYCLGAGGAPWEPKSGGPWENTYSCSLAPVFADEGTEVNSGEVGPFLSVCSQLEVKAGSLCPLPLAASPSGHALGEPKAGSRVFACLTPYGSCCCQVHSLAVRGELLGYL